MQQTVLGLVEIQDLNYPSEVEENQEFNIEYNVINQSSDTLNIWGEILEDNSIIPGTSWNATLEPGGIYHSVNTIPGRTTDLHAEIHAGHYTTAPPPTPEVDIWKILTIMLGITTIGAMAAVIYRR